MSRGAAIPLGAALLFSGLLSWLLVGVVRRYALSRKFLDRPNDRSSHSHPTPRGGGLGLVVAMLAVLGSLPATRANPWLLFGLVGVALTAIVGWLDDKRSLSVQVRLVMHILAALTVIPIVLVSEEWAFPLAAAHALWWVFWAVSAINVVNFVDGIDGLIGAQALIFGAHLAWMGSAAGPAMTYGLALVGASAGFLAWNWPPARIFLGDAGSGALGIASVLGGLLLMSEGRTTLVTAFLPLYAIFLDASVTLFRRVRRGEAVTEAHRSHLYQRLANGGWGHARVTVLYTAVAALALPTAALPPRWLSLGVASYFFGVLLLGAVLDRRTA